MKYSTKITGWGEEALSFLDEEDGKFLILFGENAPEELREIAVLHEESELHEDPAPGDTLLLCGKAYDVTAVGSEALHTLRELGHCTLTFRGDAEAERPGCIMLAGEPPEKSDIKVGGEVEIF